MNGVKRLTNADEFTRYRGDSQFFRSMAHHMSDMAKGAETAGNQDILTRAFMMGWADAMEFAANRMDLKCNGKLAYAEEPDMLAEALTSYMQHLSQAANRAAEAAAKMMESNREEAENGREGIS